MFYERFNENMFQNTLAFFSFTLLLCIENDFFPVDSLSKPLIVEHPADAIALSGANVTFTCVANGARNQGLNLTWFRGSTVGRNYIVIIGRKIDTKIFHENQYLLYR